MRMKTRNGSNLETMLFITCVKHTVTPLSQVDFPTVISRTSQLPILGVLSGNFHYIQAISEDPDQTPHHGSAHFVYV